MTRTLDRTTSADGTIIAFDRLGDGPPVVLVCGGSVDRQSLAGLADLLATTNTVYNVERRGRGDSGDTAPYAIEREIEDIELLSDHHASGAYRRKLGILALADCLEKVMQA